MFLINVEKCLKVFDKVYVSSDSLDIVELAEALGAIPILRTKELCGDTPNITVYQDALPYIKGSAIIAVQACSPEVDIKLIRTVRDLMEYYDEVMTCHPINHKDNYHDQDFKIYGSIWGITRDKLINYKDPYKPTPEVLLVDNSIDIHNVEDYNRVELKISNK